MKRQDYKPRLIDRQVDEYLAVMGAVVIEYQSFRKILAIVRNYV